MKRMMSKTSDTKNLNQRVRTHHAVFEVIANEDLPQKHKITAIEEALAEPYYQGFPNTEMTDDSGRNLLQAAAYADNAGLIRLLVKKYKFDVNAVGPFGVERVDTGATALYIAASNSAYHAARALLELGADQRMKYGLTKPNKNSDVNPVLQGTSWEFAINSPGANMRVAKELLEDLLDKIEGEKNGDN